jgi:hypothetical protein
MTGSSGGHTASRSVIEKLGENTRDPPIWTPRQIGGACNQGVHERSFWTALNRALAGVKSGPQLSQPAVGAALPLSLAMFALMVPGQRGGARS